MTTTAGDAITPTTATARRRVVWLWPGQAAYFGPSFHLDTHSAAVHTLAFGIDAAFTITTSRRPARRLRSVLIPARMPHRIEGSGRMLFFYLDADSGCIERVRSAMRDRSTSAPAEHGATAKLIGYLTGPGRPDPADIRRIVLGDRTSSPIDHRIRQTMETLLADPRGAPAAPGAGAPGRFLGFRFQALLTRGC
ncbi:hypothetical protein, partial [Nocardia cyriacigeorgica]|uniref:hypothetical protein n=1 Tax=Nocardia cyriacigeorgica TaxID=135487 RepID=UPI0024562DFE